MSLATRILLPLLAVLLPALACAQRADFLASKGGEIQLFHDLNEQPLGPLPVSPDGWSWLGPTSCGRFDTQETHSFVGPNARGQLNGDASESLIMATVGGRLHFYRLPCEALDADPVPLLDLPIEYPMWPNFICDLRSLPDGRICVWSSPMEQQCDGGRPRRDGFRWLCADPSDATPEFEEVFSTEDLAAAQPYDPSVIAQTDPVDYVQHTVPNRMVLPDGTQVLTLLKSFVARARPGGNGRPRPASVATLMTVSPDGEITPIISHFAAFEQMGWVPEHNAVVFGPFDGFEWDDRQIGVRGSGGNPGSQRGRFHGVGLVVVPLDPAERGRYGVLSLTEQMYRAFPDVDWTDINAANRPRVGTDAHRNVLYLQHQDRLYQPQWDPAAVDLDFDGLTGAEEAALGTSDFDVDSDGGGVMDHTEAWLTGSDPSDRLDDPGTSAVQLHFSHSPLIHTLCVDHPRVAREPTRPTITDDGAVYLADPQSGETRRLAPAGSADDFPSPLAFAAGDGAYLASQVAPYRIGFVAPGQPVRPVWDLAQAGEATGNGVYDGVSAPSDGNHLVQQAFALRPMGVLEETGQLLVETRGTMNTHVVAVHPEQAPIPVWNKQQVMRLANGRYTDFGYTRFDFPTVFRPTGFGEYLTELGVLTPWLHAANTMADAFSTQFNAQFAVPFDEQQWVRMERTVLPGDTLLLAGKDLTGRPHTIDGPERGGHMLYKIGPLGGFVPLWDEPFTYLNQVIGMGANAQGRVCVVDRTGELFEFVPPVTDTAGNVPQVGGANGVIEGVVDCDYAPNGDLFLLDAQNHQILRFVRETDAVEVASPLPATGTFRTLAVDAEGRPAAFERGGLRTASGDTVIVDEALNALQAGRSVGSLAVAAALDQPGVVPSDLVMHLGERPDGLWVALAQTPDWRPMRDGSRPAAKPIELYVFDPVTGTHMRLTGGNIVGNVDYANQAIAQVPGGIRQHPCDGAALPAGQTPISLMAAASTDPDTPPADPEAVQPSGSLRGTPIPLEDEGCQQLPGPAFGWLAALLLLGRRRRRASA